MEAKLPEFSERPGSDLNDLLGLSDEQIGEKAYLIDRRTRPMTLLKGFQATLGLWGECSLGSKYAQ